MTSYINKTLHREAGFTLIEVLIVVSILGALAGIAIPYVVTLMDKGKIEAYATEKDNLQTAITTMLYESETQEIGPNTGVPGFCGPTSDMDLITTTDNPQLKLSSYVRGLNNDGTVQLNGVTYVVDRYGHVTQNHP